jgi:hypothetical protein
MPHLKLIPCINQQCERILTDFIGTTSVGNVVAAETYEFSQSRCRVPAAYGNDTIVNQRRCLKRNDVEGNQTPSNFCYRHGADC